jgi:hypothetical protein
MEPQHYAQRTAYRPPAAWYRRLNWLGVALTSMGLAPRNAVTLEVRGRTSGRIRRLPVVRTRYDGHDHLVALAGESQWVRNVRAADGCAVIRRGRARRVHLDEVPATDRAEVIDAYLRAGRARGGDEAAARQARSYFGVDPDATLEEIDAVAAYYPVFRIVYDD